MTKQSVRLLWFGLRSLPYLLFLAAGVFFALLFLAGFKVSDAFECGEERSCSR